MSKHVEPAPVRLVKRLENSTAVDPVGRPLDMLASRLLSLPRSRDVLGGAWLGHAVHPALTDVPIGAWTATSVIDLLGGPGSYRAAEQQLTLGLLAAVPAVAAGLAEWERLRGPERRIGIVHAVGNIVSVGLYGASLLARRRGHHRAGVTLALAGATTATLAGHLGGHLALVRHAASHHLSRDTA
jgi:uncharacterized membrane protein